MMNRIAFLVIFISACAIAAHSQTVTGNMRGIVTDGDNQPVDGATIIISSKALIGQTRTATTTASGTCGHN